MIDSMFGWHEYDTLTVFLLKIDPSIFKNVCLLMPLCSYVWFYYFRIWSIKPYHFLFYFSLVFVLFYIEWFVYKQLNSGLLCKFLFLNHIFVISIYNYLFRYLRRSVARCMRPSATRCQKKSVKQFLKNLVTPYQGKYW